MALDQPANPHSPISAKVRDDKGDVKDIEIIHCFGMEKVDRLTAKHDQLSKRLLIGVVGIVLGLIANTVYPHIKYASAQQLVQDHRVEVAATMVDKEVHQAELNTIVTKIEALEKAVDHQRQQTSDELKELKQLIRGLSP